jgi:four helix bundle protein
LEKSRRLAWYDFTTFAFYRTKRSIFNWRANPQSVVVDIAEGTGRESVREARYFFNIAKGSVYEVVSLLYVMRKSGYVADEIYSALYEQCDEIARMLSGMMKR